MEIFLAIFVPASAIILIVYGIRHELEKRHVAKLSPEEAAKFLEGKRLRQAEERERRHQAIREHRDGTRNAALICPHCQTKGKVRTKAIKKKVGVSGSKAAAAVLTAGVSVLATGLSRKEAMTQAHCDACGSTWTF